MKMGIPEPREQEKLLQAQGAAAPESATPLAAPGEIEVWLSNNGGSIALAWINRGTVGRWDYVALFNQNPVDPRSYLTNQWQYIPGHSSPYVTGTSAVGAQYWIAYCGYDYSQGKYVIEQSDGPFRL
jgi:hypothetical protein